jgi:hypothetical protein
VDKLLLLYCGTILLLYLSHFYYAPEKDSLGRRTSARHFLAQRADVFMVIVIVWMTFFSALRTSYNDSPLSSKRQKIFV